MADANPPVVQKQKKKEVQKRTLKSTPRKDGVPPLKKPKSKKKWFWGLGAAIVVFLAAAILTPKIGTVRYGICKTFVELHDPYPQSLEFVQSEEIGSVVILDYNRVDSFGQRSLNQIRCFFTDDPIPMLKKVNVNGKGVVVPQEDPEVVKEFNVGIPALMKDKPSLIMPKGLPDDIKNFR